MYTLLLIIHVIVCVALILAVLLQSSKGGGLGGTFGGSNETLFGGQGASSFLKKATRALGVAFMVITILLALSTPTSVKRGTSEVAKELQKNTTPTTQPAEAPAGFEVLPEQSETDKN